MIFSKEDIQNLISDNETLLFLDNSSFGNATERSKLIVITKKDIANNPITLASKDLSHKHNHLANTLFRASVNKAKNNFKPLAKARGLI